MDALHKNLQLQKHSPVIYLLCVSMGSAAFTMLPRSWLYLVLTSSLFLFFFPPPLPLGDSGRSPQPWLGISKERAPFV